jgi:crotonobetainyl-CoA:carnitine CoA-transferase CaiB-like acyl-CoA transferase
MTAMRRHTSSRAALNDRDHLMSGMLDGVKVIELTTMITGPLAGMLLADLGASIVKVENPDGGDPFRYHSGGRYSGHFIAYNRNKRSLTLDLRSPRGKDILKTLLKDADVLIDNFRHGVLDRLGFSDDVLTRLNPRLIHASITGFGRDGPYAERPSYDAVAQSLSGVLCQFVDPETPQVGGPTLSDNITGFYAAYAILGALHERNRTGKGRRIETSMLEATIAFAPDAFINHKRYGVDVGPLTRVSASQSYAFRCSDGRLVAIHMSSQVKFWEGLLAALERPDIGSDPRFDAREKRIANYALLRTELGKAFATRPRAEWTQRLEAQDVPYAPVHTIPDVIDDPQVRHLGTFYQAQHPAEGEVWGVNPPIFVDGQRPGPMHAPPVHGEHSDEVLKELGFADTQIAELKAAKVV